MSAILERIGTVDPNIEAMRRKVFEAAKNNDLRNHYVACDPLHHGRYSRGEVFKMSDGTAYKVSHTGSFEKVK